MNDVIKKGDLALWTFQDTCLTRWKQSPQSNTWCGAGVISGWALYKRIKGRVLVKSCVCSASTSLLSAP